MDGREMDGREMDGREMDGRVVRRSGSDDLVGARWHNLDVRVCGCVRASRESEPRVRESDARVTSRLHVSGVVRGSPGH